MVVFPNAKINIGLGVLNKRPDGYHTIETALFPTRWCDVLEIVISTNKKDTFSLSGIPVDTDSKKNLVLKTYELLRSKFDLQPVNIHLHKIIPFGAGLGGGSSDAAYTIKVLNDLFVLNLSEKEMESFASEIGSDCPFFIKNIPAMATGIGTDLEPIVLKNVSKHILVVFPDKPVNTTEAYGGLSLQNQSGNVALADKIAAPIEEWKSLIVNDFEANIFRIHNELSKIKELLYESGAIFAGMSGSGSCLYGIYNEETKVPSSLQEYLTWKGKIVL